MKTGTRLRAAAYLGVLVVLPILAVMVFIAMLWSVIDARPKRCVVLALALTALILLELAVARSWRMDKGLYAFQAALVYLRYRRAGPAAFAEPETERLVSYLGGIPGLEEQATVETAKKLYAWGEQLLAMRGKSR